MKPIYRQTFVSALVVVVLLIGGTSNLVFSQTDGSGSSRSSPARATRPQTPAEFYSNFWRYLAKPGAAYNTWKVLTPEKNDGVISNPHGESSKTFADKTAADDAINLPIGSILVREDHDEGSKRQSISVMYRVKGYDKDQGNWYWLKYQQNGSIVRDSNKKAVAGKVASCIECHAKAKGRDFVFSNDHLQIENEATAESTSKSSDANANRNN